MKNFLLILYSRFCLGCGIGWTLGGIAHYLGMFENIAIGIITLIFSLIACYYIVVNVDIIVKEN